MKGNKKLLIVAILLLLITVSFTTYAIYKSTASGDATINTAAWVVKVNDTDITTSAHNTFTVDTITWTTSIGQNNKIAPGDKGTVDIEIDATGSEVNVYYEITFGDLVSGTDTITNDHLRAVAASGSELSGTIPYGATMTKTVTLDVEWVAEDTTTQNDIDIATAAKSLKLPVNVMVRQNPAS